MMAEHIQAMSQKDLQLIECRTELEDKIPRLEGVISRQSRTISQGQSCQTRLQLQIQSLNSRVGHAQRELRVALTSNAEIERRANQAQGTISETSASSAYQQGKITQLEKQAKDLKSELATCKDELQNMFFHKHTSTNLSESVERLRRDAEIATKHIYEMSNAKDVDFERLVEKKRGLER
ncbi:hypothetical protein EAF00_010146 [Botryotinia globosa]|nr:hypothetical protein EAF00_010146 [Botryotinia globosa]